MAYRSKCLAIAAAALVFAGCASPTVSNQQAGDAEVQKLDRAIELDHGSSDAYFLRAKYYFKKDDFDHAIADFSETIRLTPDASGALTLRGMAYAQKGDFDRAIADYRRALELSPDLGMAEGGLEEAQEAKARIAGGQVAGDPRAWCDGKALPQEGFANDLQVSGCTKLIESGKETRRALAKDFFNRAKGHDFAGDHDRAIADYSQVIALDPKNADAYGFRGMIYWLQADYLRAVDDFNQATRLKPDSVLYFMYRGESHHARGHEALAIRDFNRVLKLSPNNAEAFVNRCTANNARGDYRKAISDCTLAIRFSHTSEATEGHNGRGDAYFHLHKWDLAIAEYNQALKLWPEYPRALYGRGAAKTRLGDDAGGRADIAAAAKLQADISTVEAKSGITPFR